MVKIDATRRTHTSASLKATFLLVNPYCCFTFTSVVDCIVGTYHIPWNTCTSCNNIIQSFSRCFLFCGALPCKLYLTLPHRKILVEREILTMRHLMWNKQKRKYAPHRTVPHDYRKVEVRSAPHRSSSQKMNNRERPQGPYIKAFHHCINEHTLKLGSSYPKMGLQVERFSLIRYGAVRCSCHLFYSDASAESST